MAKQTFGGDDDEEAPTEEKKQRLDLSKFSAGPDVNPRELFWNIISSYAAKKGPGVDLGGLEMERFALVRVAIGALDRPSPLHASLTPNYIARYTLMMVLDAGWQDCFVEFLEECQTRQKKSVVLALKKLGDEDVYAEKTISFLRTMLRHRESSESALRYIKELNVIRVVQELKKELIILARGDIGENQLNAISALSYLRDDDVLKTMIVLLSHWDDAARMTAAEILLKMKNEDARTAAKKRLDSESDPQIRKILEKIAR